MNETGRKIQKDIENPIDNILIDYSESIGEALYEISNGTITPNMITTISLICSVLGSYFILKQKYIFGAWFYALGYFFDCLDGNYARKYNMTTVFGDWYDHLADLIKYLLIGLAIYLSPVDTKYKLFILFSNLVLLYLLITHLGCQEKNYNSEDCDCNGILRTFLNLCPEKKWIHVTKYFGCGTMTLFNFIAISLLAVFEK